VRGLLAVGVLSVLYDHAERLYERRVPPVILLFKVGVVLSIVYGYDTPSEKPGVFLETEV
jgi:hypothetical protein